MERTGWASAIASVAHELDELEQALDHDAWDDRHMLTDLAVDGALPDALVPTARDLVERIAALERRLVAELSQTREALHELDTRRRAARGYQSEGSALGGPQGDD